MSSSLVDNSADDVTPSQTAISELPDSTSRQARSEHRAPRFYQPGLDVLRCIAFFLVFNHHVLPKSRTGLFSIENAVQEFGAVGVCLFFTLSAFLITELLLREAESSGTIHIRAFYLRRILRIWPLYLSVLAIGLVFPHFYHRYPSADHLIVPYLLMAGNWALVFHGETGNTLLAPLWSISVEEQFYVIWPTIFLLWRRRGLIVAILFFFPLAWATDYVLPMMNIPRFPALWCNSFSQFQFFALGGASALFLHHRPVKLAPALRLLTIAAAFGCFTLSAFPCHFENWLIFATPGDILGGYLLVDLGCLLLLVAFLNANLPSAFRPLIYLGKISYGLYVFHMFILGSVVHFTETTVHLSPTLRVEMTWVVTALIVIPLAALSYEFFEKPFLRLKERFTFIESRSV